MGLDLVLRKIVFNENDYDYLHAMNVDHLRPIQLLLLEGVKLSLLVPDLILHYLLFSPDIVSFFHELLGKLFHLSCRHML